MEQRFYPVSPAAISLQPSCCRRRNPKHPGRQSSCPSVTFFYLRLYSIPWQKVVVAANSSRRRLRKDSRSMASWLFFLTHTSLAHFLFGSLSNALCCSRIDFLTGGKLTGNTRRNKKYPELPPLTSETSTA